MIPRLGLRLSGLLALTAAVALSALVPGAACTSSVVLAPDVGPSGGVVHGLDGVEVVIPPGALAQPTSITINAVPAAAAPALGGGLAYAGAVYAFEPHGLAFAAPVQVRLPLGAGAS